MKSTESERLSSQEQERLVSIAEGSNNPDLASQAFDELCKAFHAPLCAHFRVRVFGAPSDAEDLAQQTWASLWIHLRSSHDIKSHQVSEQSTENSDIADPSKDQRRFDPEEGEFYTFLTSFFARKTHKKWLKTRQKWLNTPQKKEENEAKTFRPTFREPQEDPIIPEFTNEDPSIVPPKRISAESHDWQDSIDHHKLHWRSLSDVESIIHKLRNPDRPIDQWLAKELASTEQCRWLAGDEHSEPFDQIGPELTDRINEVLSGDCIFEVDRFKGIPLRSETEAILANPSTENTPAHLNRLLIEDAYPLEIDKISRSDYRTREYERKAVMMARSHALLYQLVYQRGGYPHEILCFCCCKIIQGSPSKRGLETKMAEADNEYGGMELRRLADEYRKIFAEQANLTESGQEEVLDWMAPVYQDLRSTLRALASDRHPRDNRTLSRAPKPLLDKRTEAATMRDNNWNSGRSMTRAMSTWTDTVARRIRDTLGIERNSLHADELVSQINQSDATSDSSAVNRDQMPI